MNNNEDLSLSPSLENIVNDKSLQWIFVGGKGGVGKTTVSSCLSIQMAKKRESVLLISTDPAHNLSDAFSQKFTKDPTKVKGLDNLFVMEIEPNLNPEDFLGMNSDITGEGNSFLKNMMKDIGGSIPGIDEIGSFLEIMRQVKKMNFSVIIFDTAPTGHTLRLLSFPSLLDKSMGKLLKLQNFGGILNQVTSMMGTDSNISVDQMKEQAETTKNLISQIQQQFKDPTKTTFVCVCIPEFLSVYETERLVQELTKYEIDVHNIVVNQLVYKPKGTNCTMCDARIKIQRKYLDQIFDLYEDFHITQLPLLGEEVRGTPALQEFGKYLLNPYGQDDADRLEKERQSKK